MVERYAKYEPPPFRTISCLPTLSPVNVMFTERTKNIPSRISGGSYDSTKKKSVMDPESLQNETEEVREKILEKSRRISPVYNKGALQYITEDTDLKTLGRKI